MVRLRGPWCKLALALGKIQIEALAIQIEEVMWAKEAE
jgi:hypothetical protein